MRRWLAIAGLFMALAPLGGCSTEPSEGVTDSAAPPTVAGPARATPDPIAGRNDAPRTGSSGRLSDLQSDRSALRADNAARQADAAQAALARAELDLAAAERTLSELESGTMPVGPSPAVDPVLAGIERDRAQASVASARDRAYNALRAARLDREEASWRGYRTGTPPWKRLIRYRRVDEELPDFQRRVVAAIDEAIASGRQVGNILARSPSVSPS